MMEIFSLNRANMASTTIKDYYSIGMGNNKISIRVSFPEGQLSRSSVRLHKKLVGEYVGSFEVDLGMAKDIVESILTVETTETDISPDLGKISFLLELYGGFNPYSNRKEQTVVVGGFMFYTAEIVLIP